MRCVHHRRRDGLCSAHRPHRPDGFVPRSPQNRRRPLAAMPRRRAHSIDGTEGMIAPFVSPCNFRNGGTSLATTSKRRTPIPERQTAGSGGCPRSTPRGSPSVLSPTSPTVRRAVLLAAKAPSRTPSHRPRHRAPLVRLTSASRPPHVRLTSASSPPRSTPGPPPVHLQSTSSPPPVRLTVDLSMCLTSASRPLRRRSPLFLGPD